MEIICGSISGALAGSAGVSPANRSRRSARSRRSVRRRRIRRDGARPVSTEVGVPPTCGQDARAPGTAPPARNRLGEGGANGGIVSVTRRRGSRPQRLTNDCAMNGRRQNLSTASGGAQFWARIFCPACGEAVPKASR